MVGDPKKNTLLAIKRQALQKKGRAKLDITAPSEPGTHHLTLFFMCDSYMGCDQVRNSARSSCNLSQATCPMLFIASAALLQAQSVYPARVSLHCGKPATRHSCMPFPLPHHSMYLTMVCATPGQPLLHAMLSCLQPSLPDVSSLV